MALDQVDLPAPIPFLEPLLTINGGLDILKPLGIDEPMDSVALGELRSNALTMLEGAPRQVGGDTDVERALGRACEDIDPTTHDWTLAWRSAAANVAWVPRFVLRTPVG
jgi:hypothetical protein